MTDPVDWCLGAWDVMAGECVVGGRSWTATRVLRPPLVTAAYWRRDGRLRSTRRSSVARRGFRNSVHTLHMLAPDQPSGIDVDGRLSRHPPYCTIQYYPGRCPCDIVRATVVRDTNLRVEPWPGGLEGQEVDVRHGGSDRDWEERRQRDV